MSSRCPVRRPGAYLTLLLIALFAATPAALAFGDKDWLPIDPSHLSMSAPVVERDADAEAIFWEVRVADEVDGGEQCDEEKRQIRSRTTDGARGTHSR